MATNLTVVIENREGALAEMDEALGEAGINMDGHCLSGISVDGKGLINIVVENGESAKDALSKKDIEVIDQCEVLLVFIENRPGEFGRICRKVSDAGVNIVLSYMASHTRLVLGVEDIEKARAVL